MVFLVASLYVNSCCSHILEDYSGQSMLDQEVVRLTCIQECLVRHSSWTFSILTEVFHDIPDAAHTVLGHEMRLWSHLRRLRRLVVGLSSRRPRFDPRPGFLLDKIVPTHVFLQYFGITLSLSFRPSSVILFNLSTVNAIEF